MYELLINLINNQGSSMRLKKSTCNFKTVVTLSRRKMILERTSFQLYFARCV